MNVENQEIDGNYVGKLEQGIIGCPREEVRREAFRRALHMESDDQLGFCRYRRSRSEMAYANSGGVIGDSEGGSKTLDPPPALGRSGIAPPSSAIFRFEVDDDVLLSDIESGIEAADVSPRSLDDWDYVLAIRGRETRYRDAQELVRDLIADARALEALRNKKHTSSSLRHLTVLIAKNSGLISLTMLKLNSLRSSRRWGRIARISAADASDNLTLSWVWAQEAYGAFYAGDIEGAVQTAMHARSLAGKEGGVGATLAAALEARALAVHRDREGTRKAISKAESLLGNLSRQDVARSAFGYDEPQLRFHIGNAYTHLEETDTAWEAQQAALQLYPQGDFLDRALIGLDRAACLATTGDIDQCGRQVVEVIGKLSVFQSDGILLTRAQAIIQPFLHGGPPTGIQEARELLATRISERAHLHG